MRKTRLAACGCMHVRSGKLCRTPPYCIVGTAPQGGSRHVRRSRRGTSPSACLAPQQPCSTRAAYSLLSSPVLPWPFMERRSTPPCIGSRSMAPECMHTQPLQCRLTDSWPQIESSWRGSATGWQLHNGSAQYDHTKSPQNQLSSTRPPHSTAAHLGASGHAGLLKHVDLAHHGGAALDVLQRAADKPEALGL